MWLPNDYCIYTSMAYEWIMQNIFHLLQFRAMSSEWLQSSIPYPLWLQDASVLSVPKHFTSSSHIRVDEGARENLHVHVHWTGIKTEHPIILELET